MPVIINGTTGLSGVSTVNLANGSVTQNILANGVAGTGPAFSAYQSTFQPMSAAVYTKIAFQSEEYDTANCFDTSNYRFTPTLAGYYLVQGSFEIISAQATLIALLYKNGASYKLLDYKSAASNAASGGAYVYLNGTTDYIELYGYSSLNNNTYAFQPSTYFQAALVRAA